MWAPKSQRRCEILSSLWATVQSCSIVVDCVCAQPNMYPQINSLILVIGGISIESNENVKREKKYSSRRQ